MPKSSKKKKEKTADFSKAKLKLGKGKQVASNATDVSFKARSIVLPSQTVNREGHRDDTIPTTSRRLNLEELLVHSKHYSPSNRKDALLGLRELLGSNPGLVTVSLGSIVNTTMRLIADDDSSVRQTLLQLYTWLLPLTPQHNLIPHAAMLLLHTTSALSHIYPEIRVDAIKFMDIVMGAAPQVFQNAPSRILDGYLSLLSLKGKAGDKAPMQSLASITLSAASKLTIFRSLARLLRLVFLKPHQNVGNLNDLNDQTTPNWYLQSSFATPEAFESFSSALAPNRPSPTFLWKERISSEHLFSEALDFTRISLQADFASQPISWQLVDCIKGNDWTDGGDGADNQMSMALELAQRLQPIIIATFLDAAPNIFAPGGHLSNSSPNSSHQVEMLWCIGGIVSLLYGTLLREYAVSLTDEDSTVDIGKVRSGLKAILGRMTVYFPFSQHLRKSKDVKVEHYLHELNLVYCELASLLLLSENLGNAPLNQHKVTSDMSSSLQLVLVKQWVVDALEGNAVSGAQSMGQRLSATAYAGLSPTIWTLLNLDDKTEESTQQRRQVWNAVLEHFSTAANTSAVKRCATQFIGSIVLAQSEKYYTGAFSLRSEEYCTWLLSLPRTMCDLNAHDTVHTEIIVLILLRATQRQMLSASDLSKLSSNLVPFFIVSSTSKPAAPGPWVRIPSVASGRSLRKLCLDLVFTLITATPPEQRSTIQDAVEAASIMLGDFDNPDIRYWKSLLLSSGF